MAASLGASMEYRAAADPVTTNTRSPFPAPTWSAATISPPSVFTIGKWLPQWYERLHGEDLIAKAAKLDPAVMASPFITSIVDAVSLLVYFLFARLILRI